VQAREGEKLAEEEEESDPASERRREGVEQPLE